MGWYGVVDVLDAHGLERMRIDERYWRLSLQGAARRDRRLSSCGSREGIRAGVKTPGEA